VIRVTTIVVCAALVACGHSARSVKLYQDDCNRLKAHISAVVATSTGSHGNAQDEIRKRLPLGWNDLCREELHRPQYDCMMESSTLRDLDYCSADDDPDHVYVPPPPPGKSGDTCGASHECADDFECCGGVCVPSDT
jgi:hypothetical protein